MLMDISFMITDLDDAVSVSWSCTFGKVSHFNVFKRAIKKVYVTNITRA